MNQFSSTLYPKTNPTNPVLLDIRGHYVGDWGRMLAHFDRFVMPIGAYVTKDLEFIHEPDRLDHARRVLTRLASLSG